MTLTETIRNKRESMNLPLRKVAAFLDIDTSTYSKIEKGERALRPELLIPLCEILELNEKELTVQFWSDKLQDDLSGHEYANDILKETKKKLKQ